MIRTRVNSFIFVCLFRLSIKCFYVILLRFNHMLLAFVLLGLVSSVPSQEIGWEERLVNDLFCVEWDVQP